jgi:hypothetical protein
MTLLGNDKVPNSASSGGAGMGLSQSLDIRSAGNQPLTADIKAGLSLGSGSGSIPESELTEQQIDQMLVEAKAELLELSHQKEIMLRERKLWFFVPSPKQRQFFEKSYIKRRAGFCGNRFGKSTLGVIEDICWSIGYRPFFEEGDPLRYLGIPTHGVKGLVIAEDWDKVKEIFTNEESIERQGKFFEYLPEHFIKKCHRNEKGIVDQITVVSELHGQQRESVIYFDTVKSYKQNPAAFESSDWDFVHLDEPVVKELWTAVSRGLIDRGGFSWWLLTPIKDPWMYMEQVANTKLRPDLFWYFEATMDDNPLLADEDKQLYLDQLPADQRESRRKGTPLAFGRLVFPDFSDDYHVLRGPHPGWPNITKPPFSCSVRYAIDTHPQTPHAVLFAAVSPDGSIDIYDEIFEKCRIKELAALVKAKLVGLRVDVQLCEPAAWNEDQGSGTCYADMFYEEGLDLVPGSKRKEDAIMLVQQLFKQRTIPVRIHERCVNLRREIAGHFFDKDDKPTDKNDHLIECLRRLVIHDNLKYISPLRSSKPLAFTAENQLAGGDLNLGPVPSLTQL